ncbi:MAG TPA: helix-turn-helix domain-containing protein [bacterium]
MTFDLVNTLLLLGAAQGLFLSALIFHKHRRLFANRFLAALMLLYSLILLNLVFWEVGVYSHYPHVRFVLDGLPFLHGPLHYLYASHLIRGSKKFRRVEWLHFLPFVLYKIYAITDFSKSVAELSSLIQNFSFEHMPLRFILFNWVITFQSLAYLIVTILILNRYASVIKDIFSTTEKVRLDWLRNITYTAFAAWIIFLIENAFLLAGMPPFDNFNIPSLMAAIYVYVMGYIGLVKSEIFSEPVLLHSMSRLPEVLENVEERLEAPTSSKKYEKSGLTTARAKKYLEALLSLMQDKQPFTDSELTLYQLSEMLAISPHNLSEVINTQLQQNFFDFVNGYRVEKVKRDLTEPSKQHLTLLAIALDAGFNSKSSFNATFKKHTGLTPSEYRRTAA